MKVGKLVLTSLNECCTKIRTSEPFPFSLNYQFHVMLSFWKLQVDSRQADKYLNGCETDTL